MTGTILTAMALTNLLWGQELCSIIHSPFHLFDEWSQAAESKLQEVKDSVCSCSPSFYRSASTEWLHYKFPKRIDNLGCFLKCKENSLFSTCSLLDIYLLWHQAHPDKTMPHSASLRNQKIVMFLASRFFSHSQHHCSDSYSKYLVSWAAIPSCGLSHIRVFIIIPLAPAGQYYPTRF